MVPNFLLKMLRLLNILKDTLLDTRLEIRVIACCREDFLFNHRLDKVFELPVR